MRTLQAELAAAADPGANVLWSLEAESLVALEADGIEAEINSTTGELSLAAAVTALEAEHKLTLVADDGNYRRMETLFVAVVAAEPKPRLKLSLTSAGSTVASLSPSSATALSVKADLEGKLPEATTLGATLSFRITIEHRREGVVLG